MNKSNKYHVDDVTIDDNSGYSASFDIQTKDDCTSFISVNTKKSLDGRCEHFFKIHYNIAEGTDYEGPWIQVVYQPVYDNFGNDAEYEEFMSQCADWDYCYEGDYYESSISDKVVFRKFFKVNPELFVFGCGELSDDVTDGNVLADYAGDIGRGWLNYVNTLHESIQDGKEIPTFALMELKDVGKTLESGCLFIGRMDEGIETYRIGNGKMGVRITDEHQKGVDTGNPDEPSLFVSEIEKELVVYSIFKRTNMDTRRPDRDGNPLIYGLKREFDWVISEEDREEILKRVSSYIKEIPRDIDVVISVPSGNFLNREISKVIAESLGVPLIDNGSFCKFTKEKFFDMHPVDDRALEKDGFDVDRFYYDLENVWCTSDTEYFRFHDIPVKMRKYINVPPYYFPERRMLELAEQMNGKNVMVIDDTVTTGASLKYACECIVGTFDVKTLTYVSLFSPKNMGVKFRKPRKKMTLNLMDSRRDLKF